MTTAGKTLVVTSSGTNHGQRTKPRKILTRQTVNVYEEVLYPLPGVSSLPSVAYTTAAMTTAGKTLVLASSGTFFGTYARVYKVVLFLDLTNTTPLFFGMGAERR